MLDVDALHTKSYPDMRAEQALHIIYPRNHVQRTCSNDLNSCRNFLANLWLSHKTQCLHQPIPIPVKQSTKNGNV